MNPLYARRRLLGRNVYKKTVEGNPAIAQGSLSRRNPGIGMRGWTEQAQYEGKNLFSIDDFDSNNKATIQNGTILFNQSLGAVTYNLNLGPGAYSISIARDGYSDINIKINEVAVINNGGGNNYTGNFDVSDGDSVVLEFSEGQNPNGEDRMIYDIMLNSGSTALPYEPYTGGQPSPNPDYPQPITNAGKYDDSTRKYEYEVKLTGKNLWNAEAAAETSKWVASTSQSGYSDFAIDVSTGKSITVSFPVKLPTGLRYYVGIVLEENGPIRQWLYHSYAEILIFQQATVVSTGNKIWIRCVTYGISDFVSENPLFQIEYGLQRTEYAPYRDQTITLTSDRPLTKWDRLEKRNGQWGWVYKSEEIESYTDESVTGEYFSTTGQLSTGAQVWYETTTETFVPLTASEQEAMNALHTFRPTTVLSNDCECEMTLTYKTKKSLEVTT